MEPLVTVFARLNSGTGNLPPTRVVIHATSPGVGFPSSSRAGMAKGTAGYFTTSAAGGSAHYVCDVGEEVHCLPDNVVAWHAPPNPHSIGIEICGESYYTRAQWLSPQVWPACLLAAARTRELCQRFGLPMMKLSSADLLAGHRGVCGHVDVSAAWRQSDHFDPGPNFPWVEFMTAVTGGASPVVPAPASRKEDPMSPITLPLAADGTFRVALSVEAGNSSAVVARAWISFGSCWGSTKFVVSLLGSDGKVMGPAAEKSKTVENNMRDYIEVPSGAVLATIEGVATAGAVPTAALVCQAR